MSNAMNQEQKTAERALDQVKKLGAQDAVVVVRASRGVEVQVRDGKLEKLQESRSAGMTVHVYADGRYAAHTTSDLRPTELNAFLSDAVKLTRMLDPDPERTLPPPELVLRKPAELPLSDAEYGKLDTDRRKKLAAAVDAAGHGDPRVISVTANLSDEDGGTVMLGSNGLHGVQRGTYYGLSAEVTVSEGDKRPEEWSQAAGRKLTALGKPEALGKEATQRALDRIGAKTQKGGELALVVENRAVGTLLSFYLQAATGAALQQKRSFLDGQAGQLVASELLTLRDDPTLADGLGSRSFDRDGLPAQAFPFIENGKLLNFFVDWYYGKKLAMKPTSGGWSNLVATPGKDPLATLVQHAKTGVLVTSFSGGNSNPLTGDFSVGIQGRLIVDGAIGPPVTEMNLTGNHKTFWKRLEALGNDPWLAGSLRVPSLRFAGAAIAGGKA